MVCLGTSRSAVFDLFLAGIKIVPPPEAHGVSADDSSRALAVEPAGTGESVCMEHYS